MPRQCAVRIFRQRTSTAGWRPSWWNSACTSDGTVSPVEIVARLPDRDIAVVRALAPPDQFQPAAAGHREVGHGDVGFVLGEGGARGVGALGLRHHRDVTRLFEQALVTGAHHRVVVDKQHANHGCCTGIRRRSFVP